MAAIADLWSSAPRNTVFGSAIIIQVPGTRVGTTCLLLARQFLARTRQRGFPTHPLLPQLTRDQFHQETFPHRQGDEVADTSILRGAA